MREVAVGNVRCRWDDACDISFSVRPRRPPALPGRAFYK